MLCIYLSLNMYINTKKKSERIEIWPGEEQQGRKKMKDKRNLLSLT